MLNVTKVLTSIVANRAAEHYRALYPSVPRSYLDQVVSVVYAAFQRIDSCNALYHNVEHTAHVTLVGLEILKAKQLAEGSVEANVWGDTVVALMCHDIGYARELCSGDSATQVVTGADGQVLTPGQGRSDAVLMPVHVNRGKFFVEEQLLSSKLADIAFINACIERTRFPVPDDPGYAQTADYPGLVRGADLIGQLSDPRYLQKLPAVFYEFEEIGFNVAMGYRSPGDLLASYPAFFETRVEPYIDAAVGYLQQTDEGRDIVSHLYANLDQARKYDPAMMAAAANS